jgi:hypothetical protein
MFSSKWKKRAEQVLQELTVAEQRIQVLETGLKHLEAVHSFTEAHPLARVILDLKCELEMNNLKPTKVFLKPSDVSAFLAECPVNFQTFGWRPKIGIETFFGLSIYYTAGEIRVE